MSLYVPYIASLILDCLPCWVEVVVADVVVASVVVPVLVVTETCPYHGLGVLHGIVYTSIKCLNAGPIRSAVSNGNLLIGDIFVIMHQYEPGE